MCAPAGQVKSAEASDATPDQTPTASAAQQATFGPFVPAPQQGSPRPQEAPARVEGELLKA